MVHRSHGERVTRICDHGEVSVGEWLESVERGSSGSVVEASALDELRGDLSAGIAADLGRLGTDHAGPVRVPKGRVIALQACERKALADSRPSAERQVSAPMLRGVALDRFIAHQLLGGRVLEPVEAMRSILAADGGDEWLSMLDALDDDQSAAMLDPLATVVAEDWGDVAARWLPRTQSPASVLFAGAEQSPLGVTSGSVDVELGGRLVGLPGVLVEVKSSSAVSSHATETYLYALMVAMRDHEAPAVVARWYPRSSVAATPVTIGVLESAAAGLGDAYRRWVDLLLGRSPEERPGTHCRWCPDSDVCPSAAPPAELSAAGRIDPPSGALAEDDDLADEVEYDDAAAGEGWP